MKTIFTFKRNRRCHIAMLCWFSCLWMYNSSNAQVSPLVTASTKQHNKQVIGYITQWDAWKNIPGIIPKGGYNHLNVDYSQYTILNFSFFGVAVDGSLHSGDHRNKNIYQLDAVQQPASLINTDIYSSWDMYLLHGELDVLYYIPNSSNAYSLGYRNTGSGWKNVNTGMSGSFPLAIPRQGGAPGIIELAHQKGVKVMASIGGWSMSKHFPDITADPAKRIKFLAGCKQLISMGFDGIDVDWEYPNDAGMNIEHNSSADYINFVSLMEAIRDAIGPNKLITACFTAAPAKLRGFDWERLDKSIDFFNLMTYDYNGGWSNKAGHNAPLYDYPGAEYSNFSLDATTRTLRTLGVNMHKVNLGVPFYGRGVITNGTAVLNAPTAKRAETVQPDGPIQTCADYTNWAKNLWDGTPNFSYILKQTGSSSGWTDNWDDVAKVPYKTKDNYFLSYDNERSIAAKAQYIKDNNLAGVIIWQVFGDMLNMITATQSKGKLVYCPNTISPLVNKINEIFADQSPKNVAPRVNIISPANNASFITPASITLQAVASDTDGIVKAVKFYSGDILLAIDSTAPYTYDWKNISTGKYVTTAIAIDDKGASTTSTAVNITVNTAPAKDDTGKVIVGYWHNWGTVTDAAPYIPLRNINPKYNVIEIAFAIAGSDHATMSFVPENTTPEQFAADIKYLQSQGKKVLLSIGGQNGMLDLNTTAQKQAFSSSMKFLMDQYNFDGFDIDIEGGTNLTLNSGDNDFTNPTTPKIVNLISGVKEIIAYRIGLGKKCWLTMAPETYYLHTAYGAKYGPLVGAYLPIVYGLRSVLTFIHPQYYNTGSVMALDNNIYNQGTADFIVSMSEMLLKGFPVPGTGKTFPALRQNQVAIGLPAAINAAGGGYLSPDQVKKALNYIMKGNAYGGGYTLRNPAGYPGLRGIMTWSINWDKANEDEFVTSYYDYFVGTAPSNKLPVVNIISPVNNTSFTSPVTINIKATASDADGTVTSVAFYNGSTLLGVDCTAPYTYNWTNVPAGKYSITAKATDNSGEYTKSAAVNIIVNNKDVGDCNGIAEWLPTATYVANDQVVYNSKVYKAKWWTQHNQPDVNAGEGKPWKYVKNCSGASGNLSPVVTITTPANKSVFTTSANIMLQATASDADGTVTSVAFYNGSTLLGVDCTAPYTYNWINVPAGNYSITAKATDNSNKYTKSTAVNIIVSNKNVGGCNGIVEWLPTATYVANDQIVYNSKVYKAKWWTRNDRPDINTGIGKPWEFVQHCTGVPITTKFANKQSFSILSYPNPVKGNELLLLLEAIPGEKLLIEVSGLNGWSPLVQQVFVPSAKGLQQVKVNMSSVPTGTYLIRVINQKTSKTGSTKVIKL